VKMYEIKLIIKAYHSSPGSLYYVVSRVKQSRGHYKKNYF